VDKFLDKTQEQRFSPHFINLIQAVFMQAIGNFGLGEPVKAAVETGKRFVRAELMNFHGYLRLVLDKVVALSETTA
jgi:hypothetical protein